MRQRVYRFCLSALLYWVCATYTKEVLVIPSIIVNAAVFIPPVLGLKWGLTAALGVYAGEVFSLPGFYEILSPSVDIDGKFFYVMRSAWVFLAGYMPYVFWCKLQIDSEKQVPSLKMHTLQRFLFVMTATFIVTAIFRGITVPTAELEQAILGLEAKRVAIVPAYMFACFINDFCMAMFLDLIWFFALVSKGYKFDCADGVFEDQSKDKDDLPKGDEYKAFLTALKCYMVFPAAFIYLDVVQIYGMDNIKTWMSFILECLLMMDLYLMLMLYLLLSYRRSIMMEVVFLVSMTVFLSTAVLGMGSSIAMGNLVKSHTDDSLRAMSVICRERLDRTFFCVRQAVNGMCNQAINSVESYERLKNDAAYREGYLTIMEKRFEDIAKGTDGSITYYLHLEPGLGGPKSGFFMAREEPRWEGSLPPFVKREVTDLSKYTSDDVQHVGWYYIPLRSKCATWIEPYIDPTTKSYVISYVAPIYIENHFVGVIGIEIDFNFIIHELRRMSIYDYGYVYIMTRNNIVLYHRDQPQGAEFKPNPEFQEIELYLSNGMWLGIATPLSKVNEERNKILIHLISAILIVAMLISIGSIELASKAIKPLSGMTEAAKRIASGDLNVTISYESGNEVGLLVQSIRDMAAKLEVYVYRDKLTGLRNAAAYIGKKKELEAQREVRSDLNYGVVIFDANFLKKVNDKYGHEAGNELIRRAAKVICEVFENSPVYRVGGDEFAAILEGKDYDKREELLRFFDERAAAEHFEVQGDILTVSVARGLGIYKDGMFFADVAKAADDAMYAHKAALKAKYGEDVR